MFTTVITRGKKGMENQKVNHAETNPKEIATVFTGPENSKTGLMVESYFDKADISTECSPQEIYHDKFSRYKFIVLSRKSAKTANMPVRDFAEVEARTNYIRQKLYDMELMSASQPAAQEKVPESPAYSVQINMGEFKGKTPAEVLLEDAKNIDKLRDFYKYLKDNLEKHPNNKKVMDAINEAVTLMKAGNLKSVSMQSSAFDIYVPGFRPLTRKTREDGMCFVYEMTIRCFLNGSKYPVEVTISNYYAPVVKRENGTLNVQVSKMDKETLLKGTINMSMADWTAIIEKMREQKDAYTIIFAKDRFAAADAQQKENQQKNVGTPVFEPEEE